MPNCLRIRHFLLSAFLLSNWMPLPGALLVEGYAPATNDRFTDDPSFIAGGFNLSAIARSSSNRWGTLISPNLALSAEHAFPGDGSSLVFFETNDPLGLSESRRVIGSVRVGNADLRICVLDESLPIAYQPIPLASQVIPDSAAFESSTLNGLPVFMVGRSDDIDSSVTNMAFGRNRLEGWFESVEVLGTLDDALGAIRHFPEDDEFIPYEAFLQTWDSGAPVLAELDGSLTLIGINWFVGQVDIHHSPTQGIRDVSGFSYVGNYIPEIQGISDAFAMDVTAGYMAWMAGAFGGEPDWVRTGPAVDFDQDGLVNFLEYAFVRDPLSGGEATTGTPSVVELEGSRHLALSFNVREDAALEYALKVGSSLSGSTLVPLTFDGADWVSGNPALAVVSSASNLGSGIWNLTVRASVPLQDGAAAFFSLVAE
jgi:hypothetical protein